MSASPSSSAVDEVVRREVPDWDDEIASTARFKAFSGQRPDWENRYLFWRGLILKVARHLGVLSVRSSEAAKKKSQPVPKALKPLDKHSKLLKCIEDLGGEGSLYVDECVIKVCYEEEAVRREVSDWDDEISSIARFKSLCGHRPDREKRYLIWRGLILKVIRHLGVLSYEVKTVWFTRGGLTPICIDRVLQEMYADGDIILRGELIDPTSGRLYLLLRRVAHMVGISRPSLQENSEEILILKPLLEERASDLVNSLIEVNWTSTCIITIEKFQSICEGSDEAAMLLSYLSACHKAQYFSIRKKDFIEGVKVSLVTGPVTSISSLDYDSLHLSWTTEKLQKQLDVIDRNWEISRKMALVSLKSGNKQAAYRHIRKSKMFLETRSKCSSLLERVEEVLGVIANAEFTKKVSEAIQIGVRAIKENHITVEEVYLHLQELDDNVAAQKQISEVLGSLSIQSVDFDDDDVEEDFRKLEMELSDKVPQCQVQKPAAQSVMELEQSVAREDSENIEATKETGESGVRLTEALSKLNLEAA